MFKKLYEKLIGQSKEKWIMAVSLILTVIISLWILQGGNPSYNDAEPTELGVTIPRGFLIVPLELANAASINTMISRNGVIDVFAPKQNRPVVENLRVIKLNAGEGPLFGALVPDKNAGLYQDYFSRPHLRAAVRTLDTGPTKFHGFNGSKDQLTLVEVKED